MTSIQLQNKVIDLWDIELRLISDHLYAHFIGMHFIFCDNIAWEQISHWRQWLIPLATCKASNKYVGRWLAISIFFFVGFLWGALIWWWDISVDLNLPHSGADCWRQVSYLDLEKKIRNSHFLCHVRFSMKSTFKWVQLSLAGTIGLFAIIFAHWSLRNCFFYLLFPH